MKKWALRFLISALILFLPVLNQAMTNRQPGARSAALSMATVALPGNESLFHNQAGIAFLEKHSLFMACESGFLLKELSLMAIGAILPTRGGTFGGSFYRMGSPLYSENKAGIAYSKKLGRNLAAAIQFDYLSERLPENRESFQAFTFEGGFLCTLSDRVTAGFHLFNPVMAGMATSEGKLPLPWSIRAGTSWFLNPALLLCTEIAKNENEPVTLKTGFEYSPVPEVAIRAGAGGGPLVFSLGAGFSFRSLRFDVAFNLHQTLGLTPTAGISWTP